MQITQLKFLFLPWVRGWAGARAEVAVSPWVVYYFIWPRSPPCTCGTTGGALTNVFWLHCMQMTPMCLTGTKKTAFVQALDKSLHLPLAMCEPWRPSLWLGRHITGFAVLAWKMPRGSGAGSSRGLAAPGRPLSGWLGSRSICFAAPNAFVVFSAT